MFKKTPKPGQVWSLNDPESSAHGAKVQVVRVEGDSVVVDSGAGYGPSQQKMSLDTFLAHHKKA
jgi:hypothetical protein